MQKYHDEPKQYKGYLKSALVSASGLAVGRYLWRQNGDGPPFLAQHGIDSAKWCACKVWVANYYSAP